MKRGSDANAVRRTRATRVIGVLPLIVGVASAIALTGAAYFTVNSASCSEPARYVRHADHLELVGGCVDRADLPAPLLAPATTDAHPNYRP